MKKGISSIDAFMAIMAMLFVTFWLQNFLELNFANAQEFGVQSGVKMEAIKVGSIMNSFFAINPAPGDYLLLNSSINLFGENLTVSITKPQNVPNVSTSIVYNNTIYNSSYPVIAQINYDKTSQKVTA